MAKENCDDFCGKHVRYENDDDMEIYEDASDKEFQGDGEEENCYVVCEEKEVSEMGDDQMSLVSAEDDFGNSCYNQKEENCKEYDVCSEEDYCTCY